MGNEFERFESVEHMPLRVFNRVALAFNLAEDAGQERSKEYMASFSNDEQKQMFLMMTFIKNKGVEAARKMATAGLQTDYDPGEVEEDVVEA